MLKVKIKPNSLKEGVGQKGVEYEIKVHSALVSAQIPELDAGAKPIGGFSRHGSGDIEAKYQGKPFNIEVKSSAKDQMGAGQLKYSREINAVSAHPNLVQKTEETDLKMILDAANQKTEAAAAYIDKLKELGVNVEGFPCYVPKSIRTQMTDSGMSKPLNAIVVGDTKYITKHYNKKGVYYIQIGGAGLFYLGENPLNLPIPQFQGDARIELRIKYAGGSKTTKDPVKAELRRAEWVAIGRLMTKVKSEYSLDDVESIKKLFSVENNQPEKQEEPQTPQA